MHHLARLFVPAPVKRLFPRSPKRVVVVGGGPTGLLCAERLRHHFEVAVVDSKEFFEFTPGILRAFADPAHLSNITFDYRQVLEEQLGVEFVLGEASNIDAPPGNFGTVELAQRGDGKAQTNGQSRLKFDYCIVAAGVRNGIWKPRLPGEPGLPDWTKQTLTPSTSIDSLRDPIMHEPVAAGTASLCNDEVDERTLVGRRRELRDLRERLAGASGAVIVGGGLVGVELAGELAHFLPRVKVTLVDGAPNLLPQLAEPAREYASAWLQQQGVRIRLGTAFTSDLVEEGDVVIWCVGTGSRSSHIFKNRSVIKSNGQVRVNQRMQVLRKVFPGSLSAPGAPIELEPLGQGRVFAVGDCANIEGVPTAQMIFPGCEMAATAVANIEAAEDVSSPFSFSQSRREAEPGQALLCCTSLGPQDGMFSTQRELISTGVLAAVQKQVIEQTKMGALKGDLASTLMWMPLH